MQQPIRTPTSRDKYFNLEQEKSITRKNFEHLFTIMDEERGKPFLKFTNEILHMMDLVKRILKPLFSGPNSVIALSQKSKLNPIGGQERIMNLIIKRVSLGRKRNERRQVNIRSLPLQEVQNKKRQTETTLRRHPKTKK